jgi:lipopolysaccharide export system protein LptA
VRRALLTVVALATALALQRSPESGAKTLKTQSYEITAAKFTYDAAAATVTTAGPSKVNSEQLKLQCSGPLKVAFDHAGEKVQRFEAQGAVEFTARVQDAKGQKREVQGGAESAVLDNATGEIRLTGGSHVRFEGGPDQQGRLSAGTLTVRTTAERTHLVADGDAKLVWGERTLTGGHIEAFLPPGGEAASEVRVTGGAALTGSYFDAKTKRNVPVQAKGKEATWTAADNTAVLRGNAQVDMQGAKGIRDAHLVGEEITLVFKPDNVLVTVTRESAEKQATVTVTTVKEEDAVPAEEPARPAAEDKGTTKPE